MYTNMTALEHVVRLSNYVGRRCGTRYARATSRMLDGSTMLAIPKGAYPLTLPQRARHGVGRRLLTLLYSSLRACTAPGSFFARSGSFIARSPCFFAKTTRPLSALKAVGVRVRQASERLLVRSGLGLGLGSG